MKYFDKTLRIMALGIFCLFLTWNSNDREYTNYDAVPYVASSYLLKNPNTDMAFEYTWKLLKETADESIYQDLCCLGEYRKSMSSDQTAFASHLPSYQTKSGYILIIRLLSDFLKIDEYAALKVISQISSLLIVCLMAIIFYKEDLAIYLSIYPMLILLEILQLSRLMTPDALIGLFMLLTAYFLSKNKLVVTYSVLMFSMLLRQTNIIFIGILSLLRLHQKKYLSFFLLSFFALCLYQINSLNFSSIGYWKTFHSSLISMPVTFIGYEPEFSVKVYLELLKDKFFWILTNAHLSKLIVMLGINISLGVFFFKSKINEISNFGKLSLVFSMGALIAFILIPFPDFRIYAGPIIASSYLILKAISKTRSFEH